MKALALNFESRAVEWRDQAEPKDPDRGQVLFRIAEAGVCGTDRELARFRFGQPPPGSTTLTLGHEALGQVLAVGPEVREIRPGDWVTPAIRRACSPPCRPCARNRPDLCVTGNCCERGITGLDGYFTERALDEAADVVRVPESLVDVAVLAEPLSVVEKAVRRALQLREEPARTALILGAGPVGILAGLLLRLRGCEVSLHSLEAPAHPRACLVDSAGIRYIDRLQGVRADVVIEATGSPSAAFAAVGALGPLGVCGILGAGVGTGGVSFLDMVVGNQTVFGSVNAAPQDFRQAVEDLGLLDQVILRKLISRRPFHSLPETLAEASDAVKPVHAIG